MSRFCTAFVGTGLISMIKQKNHCSAQLTQIFNGKLHFFGNVAHSYMISKSDMNIDTFPFSVCSAGRKMPALHEQVCTFNGSDTGMPLPPSKASTTHLKISNMFHLHVVIVHILYSVDTVTVGKNTGKLVAWAAHTGRVSSN